MDSESGLICPEETLAANVHDLNSIADLIHGKKTVLHADASYQGIEKREEMKGRRIGFRVAMRSGKSRVLADRPKKRIDVQIETNIAGMTSACTDVYPRQRRPSVTGDVCEA